MCATRLRIIFLIVLMLSCSSPALGGDHADVLKGATSDPVVAARTDVADAHDVQKKTSNTGSYAKVSNPKIETMDRSKRPAKHVVKKGDWLSKIAVRYGMSVQELMALNGLASDAIDIGATLRLRPEPVQKAKPLPSIVPTEAVLSSSRPAYAEAPTLAETTTPVEEADVQVAEVLPMANPDEGLTAAQLVGGQDPTVSAEASLSNDNNVTISTPLKGTVNPLSRARLALAMALVMLGLLTLHPRTRSMLLDRLPGFQGGTSKGRPELAAIEMHASRRVGASQQVMLMEVSGTRLLIGVSDSRMDVLHRWDAASMDNPSRLSDSHAENIPLVADSASDPNTTSTRRQKTVDPDQKATAPMLTPSAEQLLDSWRQNVAQQPEQGETPTEDVPWWMEGASSYERSLLSEDGVESIREPAPRLARSEERDEVEESILATLRSRRRNQERTAKVSERGDQNRTANAHGGFRAAARLGRKPRLNPNQERGTSRNGADRARRQDKTSADGRRSSGTMRFQL